MVYCAIDIETSGLSPEKHQILSVGVIVEDTSKKLPFNEIPKFHCSVVKDEIVGDLFALNMNKELLSTINSWKCADDEGKKKIEDSTGMIFCKEGHIVEYLFNFLFVNNVLHPSLYPIIKNSGGYTSMDAADVVSNLIVAGKNVSGFDKPFLEKLPHWNRVFKIHQRTLDPTLEFIDWEKDMVPPNLTTCKQRAGISGEVTHDAIEDAWDVIQLLRTKY